MVVRIATQDCAASTVVGKTDNSYNFAGFIIDDHPSELCKSLNEWRL
jgi:hypothetical protein